MSAPVSARPSPEGSPCPCGAAGYGDCCQRLHQGREQARTAEELMRSRYSAFAVGDGGYLFRTWHPRTRPADVTLDRDVRWLRLEVLDVVDGGATDETGVVEFRARFRVDHGTQALRERSRFARRAGRWLYLDGNRSTANR